jgi:hypothetical protein
MRLSKTIFAGAALALALSSAAQAVPVTAIGNLSGSSTAPVDPTNGVAVYCTTGCGAANPSTVYSNQQTVTTSAAALPTKALVNGIVITAPSTNSATIYVGPSGVTTSTGYQLVPGTSISYGVSNLNAIYIISAASTTDTISFTGN